MAASFAAPLTSPHRCDGCLQKSLSIADLERFISDLYWIRDEEKELLDSVVTLGAGLPVELDFTIPATGVDPRPRRVLPRPPALSLSPVPAWLLRHPGWLLRPRHHISNLRNAGCCWVQNRSSCLLLHWMLLRIRSTEHVVPLHSTSPGTRHRERRVVRPVGNPPAISSCSTAMTP